MPPQPRRQHSSPKMCSHGPQAFSNENSAIEFNGDNGAAQNIVPSIVSQTTLIHSNTMDPLITSNQSVYPDACAAEVNAMQVPALSTCRRLLYGLAAPPSAMCSNILGFLMSVYLLEVAKLTPGLVLTVSFAGRFWDAVSDPLIGYLVTRTETRWGKCRIWVLGSSPFCAVAFFLFFHTPPWQWTTGRFIYYFIVYFALCTFLTTYHIPYTSMTMLISSRTVDRDAATTLRMVFEMVGTLFGVMTFTFITQHGPDRCAQAAATAAAVGSNSSSGIYNSSLGNLSTISSALTTEPTRADVTPEEEARYRIGAGIISAVVLLCGIIGFFGTKEVSNTGRIKPRTVVEPDGLYLTFQRCLKHRSYLLLMLTFMLSSLAIQTVQNSLALYTIYSLNMKPHLKYAIAIVMTTAILATPMVFGLIKRLGKKRVYFVGLFLILPVCISATLCPARDAFVPQYYVTMVVAGCYVSINMLLPWIMLPDVIDDYTIATGRRDEAAFYSLYVFFNKFAVGISTACLQLALHLTGYRQPPACQQPESVGLALRVMMGPLPIMLVLAAFFVLKLYPITPEYRRRIDRQLIADANNVALDGISSSCVNIVAASSLTPVGLPESADKPLAAPATSSIIAGVDNAPLSSLTLDSSNSGASRIAVVGCCLNPVGDSGCADSTDSASDPDCRLSHKKKRRLSLDSSSADSASSDSAGGIVC